MLRAVSVSRARLSGVGNKRKFAAQRLAILIHDDMTPITRAIANAALEARGNSFALVAQEAFVGKRCINVVWGLVGAEVTKTWF